MNFLDFIKKHILYILGVFLFIIGTGLLLLFSPIRNPDQVESQEILLGGISLDNWGIWITMIGAVLASLWAMYQYSKNLAFKQQEKASEIAKSFADSLTQKCTIICTVIEKSSLNNILNFKNIDCFSFSQFNTNEIRNIYNDDNFISKYKEERKMANLNTIYYNLLETLISNETFDEIHSKHVQYTTKQARDLFKCGNERSPFFI